MDIRVWCEGLKGLILRAGPLRGARIWIARADGLAASSAARGSPLANLPWWFFSPFHHHKKKEKWEWRAAGAPIVSRNPENQFLTDFWKPRFSRIVRIGKGIGPASRDRAGRRWIFKIFEILESSETAQKKILKDFERFSRILKAIRASRQSKTLIFIGILWILCFLMNSQWTPPRFEPKAGFFSFLNPMGPVSKKQLFANGWS